MPATRPNTRTEVGTVNKSELFPGDASQMKKESSPPE